MPAKCIITTEYKAVNKSQYFFKDDKCRNLVYLKLLRWQRKVYRDERKVSKIYVNLREAQ